jgi:hypothetical protein
VIVLALGAAAALAGGAALVSLGRPTGLVETVVGTAVAATAAVVVAAYALTPLDSFTRWWLLAVLAGFAAVSAAVARGRGHLPAVELGAVRPLVRDPLVATLGVVVALELAYVLALALFTPQNDGDAIHYHLTRPALWRQDEALGLIAGTADTRMNAFPPHAEILLAAAMTLSATARYVGLVQCAALLVAVVAIFGIARRIGVARRPATIGALLFATLPIVALQASTALNDIVVGALVAAAAFFLLRTTRLDLVLAATAAALLLGTKVTGILAVPGLALVVLVAHRGRDRTRALLALAAGVAAGSYWYVANLVRTGDAFADFADEQRGGTDPVVWLGRFGRLAIDAIELPGAVGRDRLLYVAAAAVVACVALLAVQGRAGRLLAATAGVLALLPLALPALERGLLRVHQKAWFELGRPELGNLDPGRDITKAGTLSTWYGPVGLLLTLAALVVVVRRVRRGTLPAVAVVLAAAPVVWIAAIAVGVTYFEWNGRFAMGGVALAAATWGAVLERRAVAWSAVAVAAVTVGLTLVHYDEKPSGLVLLEDTGRASVWGMTRAEVQGIVPGLEELIRRMDENVPADAAVGIFPSPFPEDPGARGIQLLPFPLFGEDLGRRLVYVRDLEAAERADRAWAVLPDDDETSCRPGWQVAFRVEPRWVVFRRVPGAACAR